MRVFTKSRGPDANGIFCENDITISNDRLSIIYLNSRSNQQMKLRNYINFDNVNKLITLHKEKYFNPDLLWSLAMFQIFRNFRL